MSKQGPRQLHITHMNTTHDLPASSHANSAHAAILNYSPACSHAKPLLACPHANLPACLHATNPSQECVHTHNTIPIPTTQPSQPDKSLPPDKHVPICEAPQCSSSGTLRCTRCKTSYYCSRSCQAIHWTAHKKRCHPSNATSPTTAHSTPESKPSLPSTDHTVYHKCFSLHCTQRARIPCEDCESNLYCSVICMQSEAQTHVQICSIIRDIRINRRWSHLLANGWEPCQVLKLVDRFAMPLPTAEERFDIMYEEDFFRQLAKDAVVYTGLSQERIHQLAVESNPEDLSRLSQELYRKKLEYEKRHFYNPPKRRLGKIGKVKTKSANKTRSHKTQPQPEKSANLIPQSTAGSESQSTPKMDPVLQQDSTTTNTEVASGSSNSDEAPDPAPPNCLAVAMVPALQVTMDTPPTYQHSPSPPIVKIMTTRRKKTKNVPKKQYCRKKSIPCLYFPHSPKIRLGLCNRKNVIGYCIHCKWSSLTLPLPRCGVG